MTIVVGDVSEESQGRAQRKIDQGAQVLPFGFSRALASNEVEESEPLLWEGNGA